MYLEWDYQEFTHKRARLANAAPKNKSDQKTPAHKEPENINTPNKEKQQGRTNNTKCRKDTPANCTTIYLTSYTEEEAQKDPTPNKNPEQEE